MYWVAKARFVNVRMTGPSQSTPQPHYPPETHNHSVQNSVLNLVTNFTPPLFDRSHIVGVHGRRLRSARPAAAEGQAALPARCTAQQQVQPDTYEGLYFRLFVCVFVCLLLLVLPCSH